MPNSKKKELLTLVYTATKHAGD